ncbi:hypothetical protein ACET3Z_012111 [Daucus carota]
MSWYISVIIVRGNDHEEAEGGEEEKDDDEEEALTLLNLSSSEQGLEEEEEEAAAVTLVTLSSSEQDPREMVRTSCQLPAERPTTSTLLICDTDRNLSLNLEKFQTDLRDCDVYDKLPEHLRIKYFELCSSQNKLLHQYLKGKENSIYAAGMIAGVIIVRGNDHEEAEGGEEEKDDDEEEALTLLNLSSSEQGLEEEEPAAAAVTLVTLSSSEQDPIEMVSTSCQLPAERPTTSTLLICDTDRNLSLNLEKFQTDLRDCDVYDKLPEHLRIKYYELCSSQNKLLHQYLKGLR